MTPATARTTAMAPMIQPHGVDSSLDDAAFVGVAAGAATTVVCVGDAVMTAGGGLAGGRCVRDGGSAVRDDGSAVRVGSATAGDEAADRVGVNDVTGRADDPPPPQAATSAVPVMTSATAATRRPFISCDTEGDPDAYARICRPRSCVASSEPGAPSCTLSRRRSAVTSATLAVIAGTVFLWGALSGRLQRSDVTGPIVFVTMGALLSSTVDIDLRVETETIELLTEVT